MSDISAGDAGAVSDAPVEAVAEEAFDLDAAVEDFVANAPDDWKGKAGKIQSELKGLRERFTPYRDAFDGLHDEDKNAVFSLVNGLKTGDTDGVTNWMLQAAKGLAGDKFDDVVKGLTPAEQQEVAEAVVEQASESLTPEAVQKMVAEAIKGEQEKVQQAAESAKRQAGINATFGELGYNTERDENGRLTDFTTQQVAMLAINNHKGDIKAAHEAYNVWLADQAKSYLQKHQGDGTLAPEGGTATDKGEAGVAGQTPLEKALARMQRSAGGPQM